MTILLIFLILPLFIYEEETEKEENEKEKENGEPKGGPLVEKDASLVFGDLFFEYTGIGMSCSRSYYTGVWLLHKCSISLLCEACLLRCMCSILIVFEAYYSYVAVVLA